MGRGVLVGKGAVVAVGAGVVVGAGVSVGAGVEVSGATVGVTVAVVVGVTVCWTWAAKFGTVVTPGIAAVVAVGVYVGKKSSPAAEDDCSSSGGPAAWEVRQPANVMRSRQAAITQYAGRIWNEDRACVLMPFVSICLSSPGVYRVFSVYNSITAGEGRQ